jgi:hypothetical protein
MIDTLYRSGKAFCSGRPDHAEDGWLRYSGWSGTPRIDSDKFPDLPVQLWRIITTAMLSLIEELGYQLILSRAAQKLPIQTGCKSLPANFWKQWRGGASRQGR